MPEHGDTIHSLPIIPASKGTHMRYLVTFILLLALYSNVFAADYRGDCSIVFHGDSTLHGFQGKASCQPFTVSNSSGVLQIPRISVAVADLDTDNSKRDKKMREMFEEKKFPLITGSAGPVALYDIRAAHKGGDGAKVSVKLKIRDIEKPVSAQVTNLVETDARLTADLAFTLSLAEYQLRPPSVLGMIRVDDKVSAKVSVILNAQ